MATTKKAPKKTFRYPEPKSDTSDKSQEWVVREPGAAYGHWSAVIGNVTGKFPKGEDASFLGVRKLVHQGIDRRAFDRIRDAVGVSTEQLSTVVGIPMRTLARRERFKPDETERLLRIASAIQKGMELFEDMGRVRRWMSSPKRALGGLTPLECCDTEGGAQEVEDLLGRLAHGVYS